MSVKRETDKIVIKNPAFVWNVGSEDNIDLDRLFYVMHHRGSMMGTPYDPEKYDVEIVLTPKFVPGFYMKRDWAPAIGTSNSTGPLWFTYEPNLEVWKRVEVCDAE